MTKSLLDTTGYEQLLRTLSTKKVHVVISQQHTPGHIITEASGAIRQFSPQLILSYGGGSCIDAGKAAALVLAEKIEKEEELYKYSVQSGARTVTAASFLPHFSIPTTLSAAEFTCIVGVTKQASKTKYAFLHPELVPKVVFLDPLHTLSTPIDLWLMTGMRAVDHAVETVYSPIRNPINHALALQGLKKLYRFLPLTKSEPMRIDYRLQTQLGAWMSLFSNLNIRMGLSHMIGHQLGSHFQIPHGATSAIMLPRVMMFLQPYATEELAEIADVLSNTVVQDGTVDERAAKAAGMIRILVERLGIAHRLRDYGVPSTKVSSVVQDIMLEIEKSGNTMLLSIPHLEEKIDQLLQNAW